MTDYDPYTRKVSSEYQSDEGLHYAILKDERSCFTWARLGMKTLEKALDKITTDPNVEILAIYDDINAFGARRIKTAVVNKNKGQEVNFTTLLASD